MINHKLVDVQRRVGRSRSDLRDEMPEMIDHATATPEDGAVHEDNTRRLASLLAVLPETYRLILWLRLGLGISAEDVATRLGCTAGAIRVRQHRGLTRLRKHLAATMTGADDRLLAGV